MRPLPKLPPHLADRECAIDALEVVYTLSDWITRRELHFEMGRRGKIWGASTLKRALAALVKAGFLEVNHTKPYGYRELAHSNQPLSADVR